MEELYKENLFNEWYDSLFDVSTRLTEPLAIEEIWNYAKNKAIGIWDSKYPWRESPSLMTSASWPPSRRLPQTRRLVPEIQEVPAVLEAAALTQAAALTPAAARTTTSSMQKG